MLTLYPYKIITFSVPNKWVLDTYITSLEEQSDFANWRIANSIGKLAFSKYFDMEPNGTYQYDFADSSKRNKFKLNVIPINDYNPKFGELANLKKPKSILPTITYIYMTWYLPRINIIGWMDETGFKSLKQEFTPKSLKPIYEHPYLLSIDKNKAYV